MIGPQTYSILRSLMAPDTPQSKSLTTITKALKKHYDPKPIVIAERYHFHLRNQSPTENIAEYVAELRRLAASCEFGTFLDEALRDRFVCGLRSDSARRKLLTEAKLTLAHAIELAQCMEQADKNSKAFKVTEASVQKLSSTPRKRGGAAPRQRQRCYRCGRPNHQATACRFIDSTCHFCGKKGHIAPACRAKASSQTQDKRQVKRNTKYVADAADNI